MPSWRRKRSGGGQCLLSSATERRILCYITDRVGLGAVSGAEEMEGARVARLRGRIRMAIEAGVDWVQIREKDLNARLLMELTREAVAAAAGAEQRTRVIVNDRLDVALAARAGGVHLGRESLLVSEVATWRAKERPARAEMAEFLIGASCHAIEEARAAASDGADYIIFGPVFETPSKMRFGPPLGIEVLRAVCAEVRLPVVAIGGINATNAGECFRAGAAGIAAIRLFQEAANLEELRERVAAVS
jgi:thiamine-phosphate pyrophosphorylase